MGNVRRVGKSIVDTETGEVLALAKEERFTKRKQEVWRALHMIGFFTKTEEQVINRLADYLKYNENSLVTKQGEYMNMQDMADAIFMDRRNMRRYVHSLIRKNAMGMWWSGDREIYYINPELYEKGMAPYPIKQNFDMECDSRVAKRVRVRQKQTSLIAIGGGK